MLLRIEMYGTNGNYELLGTLFTCLRPPRCRHVHDIIPYSRRITITRSNEAYKCNLPNKECNHRNINFLRMAKNNNKSKLYKPSIPTA